jgi:hypothetical protein
MRLRSRTSTADVILQTEPEKVQGRIVVTLGDILKFVLFFFVCFSISFLVGGWLLGFL